jgi:mono/diheme cytochrome c family protein
MMSRFVFTALAIAVLLGCTDDADNSADRTTDIAISNDPNATAADITQGQAFYVQSCLQCHQFDGGGVPGMQPALIDNEAVAGDPAHLIEIVLRGIGNAETAIPASGEYAMVMPATLTLSDEQISQMLTYIRQAFASSGPIKPEEVAAVRAKLE